MVNENKISPLDLAKRLSEVTQDEVANNVTDANGRGIIVKLSCRNWKFARLVVYHEITDEAVDLIIKKLVYCIEEFDRKQNL